MGKSAQARLLASTAMLLVWMNGATASAQSPQGGVVSAGSASIARSGGATVITQTTERGVIDWRSFSVGPQEAVRFDQPGRSSVTLNRVTGSELSRIDGRISANGQVWLANPNGVVIGPSGQVNVGGLLATTGRIDAQEFLRSGRAAIDEIARDAAIVNSGAVTIAEGGYAALAAASIRNDGVIAARAGSVALAAGRATTLDFTGDKLIQYQVTQPLDQAPAEGEPGIVNVGTLAAPGGAVLLSARAAKGVIDNVINLKGHVVANSVRIEGGAVIFGDGGTVQVAAKIDASDPNGVGGAVSALGEKVGLMDGATIDASGAKGGGVVLIGGDWQGKGAERNAVVAYVASGAAINVDATERGDGGKAVVWADDTTRFNGSISARGGVLGGHGGKVETSGKRALQVGDAAGVSTAARSSGARPGSWLLDPNNITVAVGGQSNISGAQTFTATTDAVSTITASTLQTALGTGNVVLQTTTANSSGAGDITIGTGVSISYAGANSLSFLADRHISMASGSTLNFTGAGAITFNARYAGAAIGGVSVAGHVIVGGGALVIGGGATPLTGAAVGGGGQTTGVLISGRLDSSGGAITINGKGASSGGYGVQVNAGTISAGGGAVTISGTGDGTPSSSTGIGFSNNALITSSGTIAMTGAGSSAGGAGSYGLDFYNSTIAATGGGTIDLSLTAGGGGSQGLWLNGANMSIATGALTVKTNSIGTGGTIAIAGGTGSITLQGLSNSTSIGFNGGGGGLNVDPLLAAITGTPTQVTLGRADMTGNVTGGATTYTLPFNLKIQTSTGNVNVASAVNSSAPGARSLSIATTSGTASFAGAIGGTTALDSVTVSAGGVTVLGGNVFTTNSQSFGGAVLLNANVNMSSSNGPINFSSTIDSVSTARSLIVSSVSGSASFAGAIGSSTPLASVSFDALTQYLAGGVTTTGVQNYAALVLNNSVTLTNTTNANISFTGQLNAATGAQALTINNGTGTTQSNNQIGNLTGLASITQASGVFRPGGVVRTVGTQSYGSVVLVTATNFLSTNSDITMGAVDGGFGLSPAIGTGRLRLPNGAGATTPLGALTVTNLAFGGSIRTTGNQSYVAGVLTSSGTLSTTSGNVIAATVNGTTSGGQSLEIATGIGTAFFSGALGSSLALNNFKVGAVQLGNLVRTAGTQSYTGPILLTGAGTLEAGGAVEIASTLNGAFALGVTLTSGGAAANLTGAIGGATPLTSLSVTTNNGAATFGGATVSALTVSTTGGAINQTGALVVSGTTNLSTGGGAVNLGSIASNDFATLILNAGSGSANIRDGAGGLTFGNVTAGALTLASPGAMNSTAPFTASSVSVSTTGGSISNATINGQTGATGARRHVREPDGQRRRLDGGGDDGVDPVDAERCEHAVPGERRHGSHDGLDSDASQRSQPRERAEPVERRLVQPNRRDDPGRRGRRPDIRSGKREPTLVDRRSRVGTGADPVADPERELQLGRRPARHWRDRGRGRLIANRGAGERRRGEHPVWGADPTDAAFPGRHRRAAGFLPDDQGGCDRLRRRRTGDRHRRRTFGRRSRASLGIAPGARRRRPKRGAAFGATAIDAERGIDARLARFQLSQNRVRQKTRYFS